MHTLRILFDLSHLKHLGSLEGRKIALWRYPPQPRGKGRYHAFKTIGCDVVISGPPNDDAQRSLLGCRYEKTQRRQSRTQT